MRVLLTSTGLETEEIKECFVEMADREMSLMKALFIPTAAIDAGAIEVLPKCMNDLLKCGIPAENIRVYDLHAGMEIEELQQYDVVYLCAGSLIFANNLPSNLGLIDTKLDVHCADGEKRGKLAYPLKDQVKLTNTGALVIRDIPNAMEIIGE